VDRDGVSPELRNDIEELNRRRADVAVDWPSADQPHPRHALSGMGCA
jgi:hypothetical protein